MLEEKWLGRNWQKKQTKKKQFLKQQKTGRLELPESQQMGCVQVSEQMLRFLLSADGRAFTLRKNRVGMRLVCLHSPLCPSAAAEAYLLDQSLWLRYTSTVTRATCPSSMIIWCKASKMFSHQQRWAPPSQVVGHIRSFFSFSWMVLYKTWNDRI